VPPSYEELAALVVEQAVLIDALRVELEALRRQLGRDSSNSSQPPSSDGPGAKAKAKATGKPKVTEKVKAKSWPTGWSKSRSPASP